MNEAQVALDTVDAGLATAETARTLAKEVKRLREKIEQRDRQIVALAKGWIRQAAVPLREVMARRTANADVVRAANARYRQATTHAIELGELLGVEIVSGDDATTGTCRTPPLG